jgi:hypothetical protein
MWTRTLYFVTVVLSLSAVSAQAKVQHATTTVALTPEQTELVEKSFAREKVTIEEIQKHIPLVQTYIQNTRPDAKLYAVPTSDEYMLNRVDFAKAFTTKAYKSKNDRGFFKGSANAFRALGAAFKMTYSSTGFIISRLCAASFSGRCEPRCSMFTRSLGMVRGASSAVSGSKTRTAM